MQSVLLHDPVMAATPSMRKAQAERQMRALRICLASKSVAPKPNLTRDYRPISPAEAIRQMFLRLAENYSAPMPEESMEQWASRWVDVSTSDLIGEIPDCEEVKQPAIDLIIRTVCKKYGCTKLDIVSSRRTAEIVLPRMICVYLARVMTTHSLPSLGRRFGGRDHTTMLHSFRNITRRIERDCNFAADVAGLRTEVTVGMYADG